MWIINPGDHVLISVQNPEINPGCRIDGEDRFHVCYINMNKSDHRIELKNNARATIKRVG